MFCAGTACGTDADRRHLFFAAHPEMSRRLVERKRVAFLMMVC